MQHDVVQHFPRRRIQNTRTTVLLLVVGALALGSLAASYLSPRAYAAQRLAAHNTAPSSAITGLHVQGNQVVNSVGAPVRLHGVNRSGTEYACVQGDGFFDGPNDDASIQAIAAWNVNIVRVPMNEDCWLGINGVPAAYAGANYQQAIADYVTRLNAHGIAAILELHWSAPGSVKATDQSPMPDRDHSITFWQQVASAYKGNNSVILGLFNEPFPDNNDSTTAAWTCLKNGGACSGMAYQAAGTQSLVDAIRGQGAHNIILVPGVQYTNTLDQWLTYRPADPDNNVVASWHSYNFNICVTQSCWDSQIAPVAAQVPVITDEYGQDDGGTSYATALLHWMDAHNLGYLAWTWDTWGDALSLITDYNGSPKGSWGQTIKAYYQAAQPQPVGTPVPPTPGKTATVTPPTPVPPTPAQTATATPPAPVSTPVPPTTCTPVSASRGTTVTPAVAEPGQSVVFATTVTSTCAGTGLINFAVYNAAGQVVWQDYVDGQKLTVASQRFTTTWPVPARQASGQYILRIGVFGQGWSTLYGWNDRAATFAIGGSNTSSGSSGLPRLDPLHWQRLLTRGLDVQYAWGDRSGVMQVLSTAPNGSETSRAERRLQWRHLLGLGRFLMREGLIG